MRMQMRNKTTESLSSKAQYDSDVSEKGNLKESHPTGANSGKQKLRALKGQRANYFCNLKELIHKVII
jgi:hypothetical protein